MVSLPIMGEGWGEGLLLQRHHFGAEDASGEVASVGDEIHRDALSLKAFVERIDHMRSRGWLQFVQRLANLVQVLMGEKFIDREVVVSP